MNFNGWEEFALKDINYVADKILTNTNAIDMNADSHLFDWIENSDNYTSILDFGCGIGRNTFGMANLGKAWQVVGYDNANMISRSNEYSILKFGRELSSYSNIEFVSNWNILRDIEFDVIFCSLVLQHIYEEDLIKYLTDFKTMTNRLIVAGRRFNDDNKKNTWEIIESNDFFPIECNNPLGYSREGDPDEHFACVYEW